MKILYILSILSFLALVWAAISITRHIRRNAASQGPETPASREQPRPAATPISLAGARRNPVATRGQADWANLQKTIGGHDLGNTEYPRAPNRTRSPKNSA